MKTCSKCGAVKPLTDFFKQKAAKDGHYSQCKVCAKASHDASTAQNRERVLERRRDCMAVYAAKNRELLRSKQRAFHAELSGSNPELIRTWSRKAQAVWRRKNPEKVTEQSSRRKAAKLQAVPVWADTTKIQAFYSEAKRLGAGWHVDHIVPLVSKLVCGLHCEANLQVIPATNNLSKGNKFWPDMPNTISHSDKL